MNHDTLIEYFKLESTQRLIVFGFREENDTSPFTLRNAIRNPGDHVMSECKRVFGCDFGTVCQILIAIEADLDRVFETENLFA